MLLDNQGNYRHMKESKIPNIQLSFDGKYRRNITVGIFDDEK